jgi:diguanylate cyclase (GGDEF)-like protein/PAS domain S-box-containing protein
MKQKFLQPRSIKTRVTLVTLSVVLISIWASWLYVGRTLQSDVQRLLGEQQFGTVSMLAAEINDDIQDRLDALHVIAETLAPTISEGPASTQKTLERLPIFQRLFNLGSFVTGMDGVAIATFPASFDRLGINYMDREYVIAALKEDKSSVGKPVLGRVLNQPVFTIAVPIHDPKGQVIGALVGVTDLGKPSFLDKISTASFNKSGTVSIISSVHRITVASSDKKLVMMALPPPGVNPYLDRNMAGFEGYTIVVNVLGQEQLASIKKIPAAQWYLYSGLPTEVVFAPMREMQQRILLVALVLTMLAGSFTWWMLRRQLAPIFDTAKRLSQMASHVERPEPLPITRQDEIGELVGGFNQLLISLGMRESALKASEDRFKSIFNQAPMGIALIDSLNGRIYAVNPKFASIAGRTVEEMADIDWMSITHPDDVQADLDNMALLNAGTIPGFQMEKRYLLHDGKFVWINMTIAPVLVGDKAHKVHLCMIEDITERKAAQDQIQRLAFSDALTGLPNRRLLLDRLEQTLANAQRRTHQNALLFIDVDDFKTLNDSLGHDTGDQLLKQIAGRVLTCVREGDTVARLGGDEFVVMIEYLDGGIQEATAQAELVAKKIQHELRQPYLLGSYTYHSTASIGITLLGGNQRESVEEALKRAELAMYKAKAEGRDNLCFYEPGMRSAINARVTMEADLHEAITQSQFLLYYQVQVDRNAHPTGVEALVRWQHPARGLVSPVEFIPVAEASGLILPLGHWVLQTACQQLAIWALKPDMAHLTISVNVSPRQFRLPSFVDDVLTALNATGANPKRLKLELTESLLLDNMLDVVTKMAALKSCGVGFSLDDFGTGYSSLAYLKRLPLDQLKIDQSFVRDILIDPNDAAIARMVIALADTMGLAVIAEGVETQAQCDLLEELGCHAYQGYLYGRPVPVQKLELLVQRV